MYLIASANIIYNQSLCLNKYFRMVLQPWELGKNATAILFSLLALQAKGQIQQHYNSNNIFI